MSQLATLLPAADRGERGAVLCPGRARWTITIRIRSLDLEGCGGVAAGEVKAFLTRFVLLENDGPAEPVTNRFELVGW